VAIFADAVFVSAGQLFDAMRMALMIEDAVSYRTASRGQTQPKVPAAR
jgi:hypothetical protein